jgi:putative methyltransferase (TIGR04325 family)
MSRFPALARRALPPAVYDWLRRHLAGHRNVRFVGRYARWDDAVARCPGMDTEPDSMVDAVVRATRMVESGAAAWERDSVTFEVVDYSWPLLAALMRVSADRGGLRVVDFGGSLGSTYRQHRSFLDGLPHGVYWNVVEQPRLVEAGVREFRTETLSFHHDIAAAAVGGVDAVLFAGVLLYFDDPDPVLAQASLTPARYLVLDRTPVHEGPEDYATVEIAPARIYRAVLPCRVFSRQRLNARLAPQWRRVAAWACPGHPDLPAGQWEGALYERVAPGASGS